MSKIKQLLAACVEYRAKLDELERENAALREDKERLDWLAVSETWFDEPATESFNPETFRAAIDAARKEEKP